MQFRLFILISLISILSITGLYAYAATLDIVPVGEVEDSGSIELKGPMDAAIATIDGKTYVIVSAGGDDGMEIIDISDPSSPTSVGRVVDGTDTGRCTVANGEKCLDNANGNAITTIDGSTYAIIVGTLDDGIEIIDISDPTNPTSVGRLGEADDTSRELDGAKGIAIETINGTPYAIVGSLTDDGIEIIDISDPTNPTSVGRMDDGTDTGRCTVANGEKCLEKAKGVRTTTINDKTYVIVSGQDDDGIEIIDISDPTNPT